MGELHLHGTRRRQGRYLQKDEMQSPLLRHQNPLEPIPVAARLAARLQNVHRPRPRHGCSRHVVPAGSVRSGIAAGQGIASLRGRQEPNDAALVDQVADRFVQARDVRGDDAVLRHHRRHPRSHAQVLGNHVRRNEGVDRNEGMSIQHQRRRSEHSQLPLLLRPITIRDSNPKSTWRHRQHNRRGRIQLATGACRLDDEKVQHRQGSCHAQRFRRCIRQTMDWKEIQYCR
mmetsp:Transcript_13351/g.38432  ORF Transcript_13351/g.38432 Transcript_13351/m.38432 type:complete len:230 (+) Transcript_13351:880-1569(+)